MRFPLLAHLQHRGAASPVGGACRQLICAASDAVGVALTTTVVVAKKQWWQ